MTCRMCVRLLICTMTLVGQAACSNKVPQTGAENPEPTLMRDAPADAEKSGAERTTQVSGTATYRERMALPADAVFEATLEDVSRADAQAQVIGGARNDPAGQPPFHFSISYDPTALRPGHTYAIRGRVTRAGHLLFTTDKHYALPAPGQQLELMLVRAQGSTPPPPSASTASLENTYWKLLRLGNEPVNMGADQREPHLVLHSEGNRVAGFGGCNRITGSYSVSSDKLSFSQMAGTMMACLDGMQYERAFHDALGKVSAWRIDGERLELLDESGASVAQFESRYLR